MLIHDNIKIRYSREGFLPDYPYHLISDEEMFEAFLSEDNECYFYDNYPCIDDSLKERYDLLVSEIKYHIEQFLDSSNESYTMPNWVYSYMNGATIGPNSDLYDKHYLLDMLELDNADDEFSVEVYEDIYKMSQKYIGKLSDQKKLHRPPTIFGEPHVVKILRLESAELSV